MGNGSSWFSFIICVFLFHLGKKKKKKIKSNSCHYTLIIDEMWINFYGYIIMQVKFIFENVIKHPACASKYSKRHLFTGEIKFFFKAFREFWQMLMDGFIRLPVEFISAHQTSAQERQMPYPGMTTMKNCCDNRFLFNDAKDKVTREERWISGGNITAPLLNLCMSWEIILTCLTFASSFTCPG